MSTIQRVTIYTRVSFTANRTGKGGGDGETSTRRQLERCKAYAASQGWDGVTFTHYTDEGVSAFHAETARPGWQRVIADVEAGRTDAVLVFALDRAGRNIVKLMSFVEACQRHGVAFATATQPIDTTSPYGTIILAVLAAVAQMESAIKRERARSKHVEIAEQGRYAGGQRMFGYTREMEQVPAEVDAIRDGAERFLNGESLGAVARRWNEAGFRTTVRTKKLPDGSPWNVTTVRRLLANPALAGIRVHAGKGENGEKRRRDTGTEYRGAWQPVLARSTFRRVAARLDDNARRQVAHRSDRYLLTGVLRCALCGEMMVGRPSRGVRNYVCRRSGRVHLAIRAETLEHYVGDEASLMLVKREAVRNPAELSVPLLTALDELDAKLAAWARNAATAGLSPEEIRDGRAPLAAERDRIAAELDALADEPAAPQVLWKKDAGGKFTEEWAAMIRARVDVVDVAPAGRTRTTRPIADRVTINWRSGVVADDLSA